MKKLMFAAVACAALSGFALSSKNIVGYGQGDLRKDYTGVGPTFFAIGEDVTSIQDLKVVGLGSSTGSGYTISPLTQGGNIPTKYSYERLCQGRSPKANSILAAFTPCSYPHSKSTP